MAAEFAQGAAHDRTRATEAFFRERRGRRFDKGADQFERLLIAVQIQERLSAADPMLDRWRDLKRPGAVKGSVAER